MTGRQFIAKRTRLSGIRSPVLQAFLAVVMIAQMALPIQRTLKATFFVTLAVLIFVLAGMSIWKLVKNALCPYCGLHIGQFVGFRGIERRIKHCPFCGADFDSDVSEDSSALMFVEKMRQESDAATP